VKTLSPILPAHEASMDYFHQKKEEMIGEELMLPKEIARLAKDNAKFRALASHLLTDSKPEEVLNSADLQGFIESEFVEAPMASSILDQLEILRSELASAPFLKTEGDFTFIDLFAGIGGFRLALQDLGGTCVFSSEWDKFSQKTYAANFGEVPYGDITLDETKAQIPEKFDVLCAGFPCQAFSIAGKRGGFEDTRGTLFFDVAEIIKRHRPRTIFLENVKGLISHDRGRTLKTILKVLREDLNYFVPEPQIINAKDFGVPQNRERIFIVGFDSEESATKFEYPEPFNDSASVEEVLEEQVVSAKYYLSTQYLKTLIEHKERHAQKGNGFGYEILALDGVANAVVCGGMGRERNLVVDDRLTDFTPVTRIKGEVNREGIRKLTPREWARLQGFPDGYLIPVSDASAYKQFGNSVAVPAIRETARQMLEASGFDIKHQ